MLRGAWRRAFYSCGEVRRLNLTVEPECAFVREVINNRPEFNDLLV